MPNQGNDQPKNPTSHLHVLNLIIALIGGLISVVAGIYSLKTNVFSSKTGTLQGMVIDENIAKPLWLVPVEISTLEGSVVTTATTDQQGHYSVKSLMNGHYVVKATAVRHKPQSKNIKIFPNSESNVDFELSPEEQKVPPPISESSRFQSIPSQQPYTAPQMAYPPAQQYAQNPTDSSAPTQNFRRHRRNSMGSTQEPADSYSNPYPTDNSNINNGQSGNSSGSPDLKQIAGQLLQNWASKKLGSNNSNQ